MDIDKEDEEAELKAAEDILAKSGPNGSGYFVSDTANKRTKIDQGNNCSTSSKDEDIELISDLGWAKDKKEAEALYDYSNVSNMKMYDPNSQVSDNPFFAGAAIAGVSGGLQGKQERKKVPGRKGRKNNAGGNKTRSKAKSGHGGGKK